MSSRSRLLTRWKSPLMQPAALAFDKHLAQDKHDADAGNLNDVDAWLAWMSGEEG